MDVFLFVRAMDRKPFHETQWCAVTGKQSTVGSVMQPDAKQRKCYHHELEYFPIKANPDVCFIISRQNFEKCSHF